MNLRDDHEAAKKALIALDDCKAVPSPEDAIEILAHASSCEECGRFLAERPGCAEALIESTHPHAELTPSAKEMIIDTQKEFVVFGDAVLDRMRAEKRWSGKFEERLAMELPLERRTDLWTLRKEKAPRLRCALASAESVRAVGSFLTGGRRRPVVGSLVIDSGDGEAFLRLSPERVIPGDYFVERIAKYALISEEVPLVRMVDLESWQWTLSAMMWNAVVRTAIHGGLGLPELSWVPVSENEIALSLSAEAFKESKAAKGMVAGA